MRHSLEQRVARELARAGIRAEDHVAVACSGGTDSAALSCAVAALRGARRLGGATLVYVDHGLREGSAEDGQRVAELAGWLGLEFRLARANVSPRGSLEAAAREARYRALGGVANEIPIAAVLLAHTASDQAETVLMRALRGTGVRGLAGIPPRRGPYLRPLLGVGREEIARYLEARGVAPVEDPTNLDLRHARNRVRHRYLPALKAENPRADQALARLADDARRQREVLEYAADMLLARARRGGGDRAGDRLCASVIAGAPDALAARALCKAAEAVTGTALTGGHADALLNLVRGGAAGTKQVAIPGGRAIREYAEITFVPGREQAADEGSPLAVTGPGGPYIIRTWQPGDRMRLARLGGRSRKLSDLYIDAKIPKRLRDRARVVVRARDGSVEWAEHLGGADGAAIEVSLTPAGQLTSNRG